MVRLQLSHKQLKHFYGRQTTPRSVYILLVMLSQASVAILRIFVVSLCVVKFVPAFAS